MVVPNNTPDVELPPAPEEEARRPSWWRRWLAAAARAVARGQRNAGGGIAPVRRSRNR